MSKALKTTFGVHALVALIFGAPLLIVPGRTLGLFGWLPIDPLITRLLGAAMLALAWSSFLGYRSSDASVKAALVQMDFVFCSLGVLGLLRHLVVARYPWYVWTIFLILVVFGIAWLYFLWKKPS